jgi:RES domain
MSTFVSWRDYYDFADDLKSRYRYVLDDKGRAFIRTLLETSENRIRVVPAGSQFWRACLDHETEGEVGEMVPCRRERLIPFRDKAREGRVNPRGIPCLYLTDDLTTAVMEVRPWIGSFVTVARYATKQTLSLIDFSVDFDFGNGGATPLGQLAGQEIEEFVWWSINDAFSVPVSQDENKADYAPTQYIAEAFRSSGRDGLLYKSSLGTGTNLALFHLDAVALVSRELRHVNKIEMHHLGIGDRLIEASYCEGECTNAADSSILAE